MIRRRQFPILALLAAALFLRALVPAGWMPAPAHGVFAIRHARPWMTGSRATPLRTITARTRRSMTASALLLRSRPALRRSDAPPVILAAIAPAETPLKLIPQSRHSRPARRHRRRQPQDRPQSPDLAPSRTRTGDFHASNRNAPCRRPSIVVVGTRQAAEHTPNTKESADAASFVPLSMCATPKMRCAISRASSCASATSATPRRRSRPGPPASARARVA